jgi:hypothetical protein
VSLALILADLEHEINGLLIPSGECECILVADEAAVVGELPDCLLHRGGELVVVVEAGLDQLRRLHERDLLPAVRDHLVEELQPVARGEVTLRESPIREVVQVVLCKVTARKQVLVHVYLRLVIYQLTVG